VPTVFYLSRTHKQLENVAQTLQELSKASMVSVGTVVVLAAKKHVCPSKWCRDLAAREHCELRLACNTLYNEEGCEYHKPARLYETDPYPPAAKAYREECNRRHEQGLGSCTQAEFLGFARHMNVCPYHLARAVAKHHPAFVLSPFNYLFSPHINLDIEDVLSDSVVLVDEGHNLGQVCKSSMSAEVSIKTLNLALMELDKEVKREEVREATRQANVKEEARKRAAEEAKRGAQEVDQEEEKKGADLVEISRMRVSGLHGCTDIIRALIAKHADMMGPKCQLRGTLFFSQIVAGFDQGALSEAADIMRRVSLELQTDKPYHPHVETVATFLSGIICLGDQWGDIMVYANHNADAGDVGLELWCQAPRRGFDTLRSKEPGSVIVTSGTLSPIDKTCAELQVQFQHKLSNPHVIQNGKSTKGVSGDFACFTLRAARGVANSSPLNGAYKYRSTPGYLKHLRHILVTASQTVPGGIIVFFPSYAYMNSVHRDLRKAGSDKTIERHKELILGSRSSEGISQVERYVNRAKDGAMFLTVCRGSSSEGTDFKDASCRCAVIVGIPYAYSRDPKMLATKAYMNTVKDSDASALSGDEWYSLEAFRAVNQAVGRVIRHKDDYGICILADERYESRLDNLPRWVREFTSPADTDDLGDRITAFFNKQRSVRRPTRSTASSRVSRRVAKRSVTKAKRSVPRRASVVPEVKGSPHSSASTPSLGTASSASSGTPEVVSPTSKKRTKKTKEKRTKERKERGKEKKEGTRDKKGKKGKRSKSPKSKGAASTETVLSKRDRRQAKKERKEAKAEAKKTRREERREERRAKRRREKAKKAKSAKSAGATVEVPATHIGLTATAKQALTPHESATHTASSVSNCPVTAAPATPTRPESSASASTSRARAASREDKAPATPTRPESSPSASTSRARAASRVDKAPAAPTRPGRSPSASTSRARAASREDKAPAAPYRPGRSPSPSTSRARVASRVDKAPAAPYRPGRSPSASTSRAHVASRVDKAPAAPTRPVCSPSGSTSSTRAASRVDKAPAAPTRTQRSPSTSTASTRAASRVDKAPAAPTRPQPSSSVSTSSARAASRVDKAPAASTRPDNSPSACTSSVRVAPSTVVASTVTTCPRRGSGLAARPSRHSASAPPTSVSSVPVVTATGSLPTRPPVPSRVSDTSAGSCLSNTCFRERDVSSPLFRGSPGVSGFTSARDRVTERTSSYIPFGLGEDVTRHPTSSASASPLSAAKRPIVSPVASKADSSHRHISSAPCLVAPKREETSSHWREPQSP
ncbi:DNA helicase (DNA repair), Rad3 type, partial [Kipferlia bialata]